MTISLNNMGECTMSKIPQVLTIAGSDSGGGAGIQADLKTFQMRHVFGTSVITAITAQNTLGVFDIHPIPLATIESQLEAIAEDFQISAFKIGMLGTEEVIRCVAKQIKQYSFGKFVLDPVMIAKGGTAILQQDAVEALIQYLLPLADIITPNIPETETLTGIQINNEGCLKKAAQSILSMGAKAVIIKGGHYFNQQNHQCRDWLFTQNNEFNLTSPRINTSHTHGTGCTFSACLTAELAKGKDLIEAMKTSKNFITAAIQYPLNIGQGHGPTNHWAYQEYINE